MSVLLAILAGVATLAGGIPAYPGGTRSEVGGALVLTTRDAPDAAKAKYAAVLRKAGWRPTEDDAVLNGDVPGASPEQNAAVRQAGLLLSFERDGRTADILIRSGTDKKRRPVTMLMIIPGTVPGVVGRPTTGGSRGRSAR